MDLLGIETRKNSWVAVHLKSSPLNVKIEGFISFAGASFEERMAELKAYIADKGLKDVRIAVGLPRESSLSMVLSIPAPKVEAIEGVLTYELEKHIPFDVDEAYHGYQVLKKENKVFSILLAAARKEVVDEVAESFARAGLAPDCIATWQSSLFNAFYHWKNISGGKTTAFIGINEDDITVDVFSDLIPIYSKSINTTEVSKKNWLALIEKELKFSLFCLGGPPGERKLEEGIVISEEELNEEFLQTLSDTMDMPVKEMGLQDQGLPSTAAASLGAALCSLGKAQVKINLAPAASVRKVVPLYFTNLFLASVVAALAVVTGFSYLVQDWRALRGLNTSLSDVKERKDEVQGLALKQRGLDRRISSMREIDGKNAPSTLDVLRELTGLLPNDTWLTGFYFNGNEVTVDGYSMRASLLLIKLGESRFLRDVKFSGPVVKAQGGKERFRIDMMVNTYEEMEKGRVDAR